MTIPVGVLIFIVCLIFAAGFILVGWAHYFAEREFDRGYDKAEGDWKRDVIDRGFAERSERHFNGIRWFTREEIVIYQLKSRQEK